MFASSRRSSGLKPQAGPALSMATLAESSGPCTGGFTQALPLPAAPYEAGSHPCRCGPRCQWMLLLEQLTQHVTLPFPCFFNVSLPLPCKISPVPEMGLYTEWKGVDLVGPEGTPPPVCLTLPSAHPSVSRTRAAGAGVPKSVRPSRDVFCKRGIVIASPSFRLLSPGQLVRVES